MSSQSSLKMAAFLCLAMLASSLAAGAETPAQREARMKWWTEARFGMFIHWGLYALPARHEWVKNHEKISDEAYQKYFDHFNPDLYNPVEWVRAAKNAGMKYIVITSKHHEGFCLWDSKYTDYKAPKTPAGRDLLKPLVQAARAEGIKIGFYYSLLDWHHPDYTVDRCHPMWGNKEFMEKAKGRDFRKYQEYLHNQVREILTEFGTIDVLFMDFSFPGKDGNLILNVGPTARGTFDDRATARLQGMGEWMKVNSRSIYGCTQAPDGFKTPQNCLLTYNPTTKRLYVHVLEWPMGALFLDGFAGHVSYAQLLNDASEVQFIDQSRAGEIGFFTEERKGEKGNAIILRLPVQPPAAPVPVVELFLK